MNVATGKRASLMQKLKKASMSGRGNNIRDGRYRFVVKNQGFKEGFKGTRWQAQFVVAHSAKISVVSPKTGQALDITPHSIGETVDWMCVKLDKEDEPGANNLRRYILTLVNAPDANDDDYLQTLAELSDCDENGDPLPVAERRELGKGMMIDCETVRIETVRNKKEIVIQNWTHVPDSQYDQNAMAKWIDQVATFNAQQMQLPAGPAAA